MRWKLLDRGPPATYAVVLAKVQSNEAAARGIGAAAEVFFDKPIQQLDLAQMALLAGLPQAPSDYNPFLSPTQAKQRRHEVLKAMLTSHYIT
ncbi:hypothetical protein B4Q13_20545, partial [Lacticaseibacillus rhamnosus]